MHIVIGNKIINYLEVKSFTQDTKQRKIIIQYSATHIEEINFDTVEQLERAINDLKRCLNLA